MPNTNAKVKPTKLERDLSTHIDGASETDAAKINQLLLALLHQTAQDSQKRIMITSYPACNSEA